MTNIVAEALPETANSDNSTKTKLIATGGILGAIAASTCCIVPLALFSAGISGAWIGQLTAFEPYKPFFIAITVGFLGYGYWLVYRKPKAACAEGENCARPCPRRFSASARGSSTGAGWLALRPGRLGNSSSPQEADR